MRFSEYLEHQGRFQVDVLIRRYGVDGPDGLTEDELNGVIKDHVLAITDELHEILRHTNWKMHEDSHAIDWDAIREEVVDVLKYAVNLAYYTGMTEADLDARFLKKTELVRQRFEAHGKKGDVGGRES